MLQDFRREEEMSMRVSHKLRKKVYEMEYRDYDRLESRTRCVYCAIDFRSTDLPIVTHLWHELDTKLPHRAVVGAVGQ